MVAQALLAGLTRSYLQGATKGWGQVASYANIGSFDLARVLGSGEKAQLELTDLAALERELRKVAPDLFTKMKQRSRAVGVPARNEIRDSFSRVGPNGPFGKRKVDNSKPWATAQRNARRIYDGFNTINGDNGRLSWFNNYFSINSNGAIDVNYKNRKASADFSKLRNGQDATLSVVRIRVKKAPLILIDMAGRKKTTMYSAGKYRTRPYQIDLFGRGIVTRTHRINAANSNDFVDRLSRARGRLANEASRYAYPALAKHSPKFRDNMSKIINEVVAETNRRLKA